MKALRLLFPAGMTKKATSWSVKSAKIGTEAEFVCADVRREDDVRNLVDKTVERYGRLDVAINAAGTEGKPGPVMEQTPESYAATFVANVLGTLLSMKHEMRVMLAQRSDQHRQCVVDVRSYWRCWRVRVRGEQACS
jgi:NAD(P)-dependent dehydrogenase (short-subunit alcohol dehydrogenase family)